MELETRADEFDRLYRATYRRVFAYVLRRLSETAAQDVVSEVYTVAWRKRRHLPEDDHEAALWLFGIARNVLANQARSQRRWARLMLRVAEHPPPPAVDDQHGVGLALTALSAVDQEVLRLAYWDDLPHRDIAVILGVSAAAVTTRLSRARERLRAALDTQRNEANTHADV
ncbi:sigma-70 family RNA polymerase sigma factor [Streptomyces sp. 8K308]|uniref:RNA polymerase sigma factor n=1 Tax=Streptomyces sp. 8K308 TaxID=2530388 RepID=UPI001046DDA0|nr:sigma-70 family RNA polymerase sigma factor [Streptomyces sp. 8K308]TDC27574.1 sigma-70 family RNA polymerase sigma factor [Streptomyces sp. 8K308]